ncbi:helix-turn-helix domain-containing protein [Rufibacter tibetensis]|uniref:MarR family transcriptional regulator n=1 Tax=Rufibacter tibetensis TaxID=512763 RepID=A0A0P0CRB5_9BACT|nr:hypothetical protein [Rufibacter tibetensis]ALI99970.1 hypothetical protein DC20_14555 [Rufibacter tibetensis]
MKKEEQVLKAIYSLVNGDKSPVHLPVSPEAVSEAAGLPLDQVQACCKTLETHGYLMSSNVHSIPPYYYITTAGIKEALNPSIPLYLFNRSGVQARKRY